MLNDTCIWHFIIYNMLLLTIFFNMVMVCYLLILSLSFQRNSSGMEYSDRKELFSFSVFKHYWIFPCLFNANMFLDSPNPLTGRNIFICFMYLKMFCILCFCKFVVLSCLYMFVFVLLMYGCCQKSRLGVQLSLVKFVSEEYNLVQINYFCND